MFFGVVVLFFCRIFSSICDLYSLNAVLTPNYDNQKCPADISECPPGRKIPQVQLSTITLSCQLLCKALMLRELEVSLSMEIHNGEGQLKAHQIRSNEFSINRGLFVTYLKGNHLMASDFAKLDHPRTQFEAG